MLQAKVVWRELWDPRKEKSAWTWFRWKIIVTLRNRDGRREFLWKHFKNDLQTFH